MSDEPDMPNVSQAEAPLPHTQRLSDIDVIFRLMGPGDRDPMLAFTGALPEQDLLFLRYDITKPEVVDKWLRNIERGRTLTVLALEGATVIGYCSIHHSAILWTRHLGEVRLLVAPAFRGKGIGQALAERAFALVRGLTLTKLAAQMMSSQRSSQNLFHRLGFIPEALLHDWVIDRNGRTHDLILMSREIDDEPL